MALPLYLAMTAAEIEQNPSLPSRMGYMACHFSPYGTGLSNLPKALPENAMLILNDRTPIHEHDLEFIYLQLESVIIESHCSCLLLDFQRPGSEKILRLAKKLSSLPCPVGISDAYAENLRCPVFLPPVPPDITLVDYLQPWRSREIWLEVALEGMEIRVTPEGSTSISLPHPDCCSELSDRKLHCHYRISVEPDCAKFTLFRTPTDLKALLEEAEQLGVTQAVGLWQELSRYAESPA